MADGTIAAQAAPQPAGGPPPAAVQPPAPAPAVQQQGAPPAPQPEPTPEEQHRASIAAEMNDESAENFLANFLADNGATPIVPDGQPAPQPAPPTQGQPPAQQPPPAPVNGAPAPTSGVPPQPMAPVDPALVQRLFFPGPMPGQLPQPQPQQPQQQPPQQAAMPPAPQQSQPAPQPQTQSAALPVPFDAPFDIPPQIATALNADDEGVRRQAMGALMAAGANAAFAKAVEYVQQHVAPAVASATFNQVQTVDFQKTVDRELYGNFPHLRMASPQLLQQAASVIVQDELARNPYAAVTPQTWQRIGQLASAGLQQMAAGQPPQFQPQQPPAPMPAPQPPQPVWNGYQWVYPQAAPTPQPAAPFIAGQSGMPFGAPQGYAPTPESEAAAFMAGQWGN